MKVKASNTSCLPNRPGRPNGSHWLVLLLSILSAAFVCPPLGKASEYSPEHPRVKAMIQKARGFLETTREDQLGYKCMVAMALVKSGKTTDSHPLVKAAIAHCRAAINDKSRIGTPPNYHLAIALLFLADTNPGKYRPEMEALLNILLARQKNHGGWSYESRRHGDNGDSSMTQYMTLGFWAAKKAGINVPQDRAEKVFNFWLNTQTPEGAWAYQSLPGGELGEVRPSIAVAGLSSIYVCAELFGLGARAQEVNPDAPARRDVSGIAALQDIPGAAAEKAGKRVEPFRNHSINVGLYESVRQKGVAWIEADFAKNKYGFERRAIYLLYALERYRSFRELVDGQPDTEAAWYDAGVEFLEKRQRKDGSWKLHMREAGDTAFALLFLIRSSKKSINYSSGLLKGARGLDKINDVANMKVKNGEILADVIEGGYEDFLSILGGDDEAQVSRLARSPDALLASIAAEKDAEKKQSRLDQLKKFVSTGKYHARLIAVRTLARSGDVESVPTLIYALTDPDHRVMVEARDGLRFISRKFDGFGLKSEPRERDRNEAIAKWREWYESIQPEGASAE